jgi:hypothetical protein
MTAFCNEVSLVTVHDAASKDKTPAKHKKTGQEWCVPATALRNCPPELRCLQRF